ncbi:hypothetical protein [Sphingobium nicotianae]|uniref:Uncharacterized protein n=1 Tax=Sphingobium nicotianae TaxID=2782607 RepID=A0A9X1DFM5_9SPHN|nr:hypothetical protein [Sphingobium nicotianae]MBT2188989.1 hypothetical protein [Sphingobium nicotianae]
MTKRTSWAFKPTEIVSLAVSVAALALSAFVTWDTQFKERLQLSVVGSTDLPQLLETRGKSYISHNQTFTFFNGGNRSVAVNAIYMAVWPVISIKDPKGCAEGSGFSFPRLQGKQTNIVGPFKVNPGDIEVKDLRAKQDVSSQINDFDTRRDMYFKVCIYADVVSPRYGNLTKPLNSMYVVRYGSDTVVRGFDAVGFPPTSFGRRLDLLDETRWVP